MERAPRWLHHLFIFHFFANASFAIPLFIAPTRTMAVFGLVAEPFSARLLASAVFGIGLASLLMRNKSLEQYRSMLLVKASWSGTAILGIVFCIIQGSSPVLFLFLAVFLAFWCTWMYSLAQIR